MRIQRFALAVCLAVLLSFSGGCRSKGSEYVGKWIAKDARDSSRLIEISQNGEGFIMLAGGDTKMPMKYDANSHSLKAGFVSFSYVKASDTILASDGTELKRVK
jgi:hypothetical protein